MSRNIFAKAFAILLTVSIVAPSAFFIAPQRANAIIVFESGLNLVENTISAVNNVIQGITGPINTAANVAEQINTYVLQPLAFVLSGNLMKMLTAGVIGFVIGKANGTGVPQFVVDVMKSYQTVADGAALAYLKQVGNTNSPFAGSISSALRNNYLQKTTLAGFWNANLCTLAATSPNVNAYLAGNWSQGGVKAWFALTTQVQNNPYMLSQSVTSQLAGVVGAGAGGATGARASQLSWGQGFMSWCGANEGASAPEVAGVNCSPGDVYDSDTDTCVPTVLGVNPGDACTNSDGTPGTVQTPGSTIKATLDKVLGGQQDQIVRMGNVGGQINDILGKIGNIINTVNFASELLGGGSDSGLLSVGNTSSSNPASRLAQFGDTSNGYLGVTNTGIYKGAAADSSMNASATISRISEYQTAWTTIEASTKTASTSVASLAVFCTEAADAAAQEELGSGTLFTALYGNTRSNLDTVHTPFIDAARAQANAATTTIATMIAPVFAQAATAATTSATAMSFAQKVQSELSSGVDTGSAYADDIQTLQTMSPTTREMALAQQDAQVVGTAEAIPAGSLNVTSSSIVSQMNLISANAQALKTSVCTPPAPVTGG